MFGYWRYGRLGGAWMRGCGLGFTNPVETVGVWNVYLCLGCGRVGTRVEQFMSGETPINKWQEMHLTPVFFLHYGCRHLIQFKKIDL